MASADLVTPEDVKDVLQYVEITAAEPLKEELSCDTTSMPLNDALVCKSTTIEALPSVSTAEALFHNTILSEAKPTLPYTSVTSTPSTAHLLAQPMENLHATLPPPFLTKLYDMIEDLATNSIVSWSIGNNSFVVWNSTEFSQCLLPRYFKHNNFSSFVRQLNTYGFKKVNSDLWEFAHGAFLRGQKHLLKDIHRRKTAAQSSKNQSLQQQLDNSVVSSLSDSCVEVGNFGIEGEIERLKRDKCALAAEVVRLRQLQQSSEHETLAMAKRVQMAEKRQEQMMNFLAKAIQNPAFLAQLMQQSERWRLDCDGKKRKHLLSGTEQSEPLVEEPQVPIGRFDTSLREVPPSLLLERAGKGQSAMTSPAPLAMSNSLDLDSVTTRLGGFPEDAPDDLDLDFNLQDFIEEIIPVAENNPPGNAYMQDVCRGEFVGKPGVSGACSDSNIATAVDNYAGDADTSGTDH